MIETMTSPTTSTSVAVPPKYEYLKSLSDIQSIRDLSEDAVRDILRQHTCDHGLEVLEMGAIEDMSGLNDAFNSTICALRIKAKFSAFSKPAAAATTKTTTSNSGDSSGSDMMPKVVQDSANQEKTEEEFHFVIKSPPKMSFIRQVHKLSRPFFNEVSWYLDLVPQLDIVFGKGSIDRILPTCYHAYSSYYANDMGEGSCCIKSCPWFCWLPCRRSEQGVLILENVKKMSQSFEMYDKRKPLPLNHIRLIFAELAHFHGKWLVWIQKCKTGALKTENNTKVEPISFNTFKATYNTQKRIPKLLYQQLKNVAKKTVIKMLHKQGEEQEREYIAKCEAFFNRSAMRMLNEYMDKAPTDVFTLCHGDFWSNNIMFSYPPEDQAKAKPNQLIIIDYQLINYGHPAYDLVYFTYLNTDLEFRDAHLKEVLKEYYDIYHSYLMRAYPDMKYSFEDFIGDFHYHKPVGFTTACSVMPNVMSTTQLDLETAGICALRELQQKQEQELNDDTNPSSLEIRRRIVQMVHEMARDGVI
eukprot:TCALIF_05667-PA protein Name:"Protein of unknown function" AED:0.29 eAED:0.29 QI:0/0.66/0.5/0.75/0.33/0.25/4/114/526